jgi:protein-L-isoaspartate(D-aspartate) O-methyltransferase
MDELIQDLINQGYLKSSEIIRAFGKVDRAGFVLKKDQAQAYLDNPLPIGEGQTISQPLTVAFMLEHLKPQRGQKVLDLGSGSGWQTALLAEIVGSEGGVWAMEVIPELFHFGQDNILKAGYPKVHFILGDGSGGLPDQAPFDRIIAGATFPKVPEVLKKQLDKNGRMVLPVKDSIILVERIGLKKYKETEFPYFSFVPMRGKHGYQEKDR